MTIVLTGVALGFGFNMLALRTQPPRGLPWVARPKAPLEKFEDRSGGAHGAVPAPAPAPVDPVDAGAQVAAAAPVRRDDPPAAKAAAPPKTAPAPAAADPDDPMGGSLAVSDTGGLPDIPDLDRPLSVELATVRKFVDASAAMVLDAREPDEYAAGHIPGALNVPYDTAGTDPAHLQALDPGGRPIIIYCGGGTCEVSMSLAETLIYQFARRKVLVYTGGWPDWVAAGLPVAKGTEAGGKGR